MKKRIVTFLLLSIILFVSCEVRFSPEVVDTFYFLISLTTLRGDQFEFTTAQLVIKDGNEIAYSGELEAKTNMIELPDAFAEFTLIITKPGYLIYEQIFTTDELKKYMETPLVIVLEEEN